MYFTVKIDVAILANSIYLGMKGSYESEIRYFSNICVFPGQNHFCKGRFQLISNEVNF